MQTNYPTKLVPRRTDMGSTSTLVTGSFSITNLTKNGDFVGVSCHRDHGQVLITDSKSTSLYMVRKKH